MAVATTREEKMAQAASANHDKPDGITTPEEAEAWLNEHIEGDWKTEFADDIKTQGIVQFANEVLDASHDRMDDYYDSLEDTSTPPDGEGEPEKAPDGDDDPQPLDWESIFHEPRQDPPEGEDLDWEQIFGEPRPERPEKDESVAYEDQPQTAPRQADPRDPHDHIGRWYAKAMEFAQTPDHHHHRLDIFQFLNRINGEVSSGHLPGLGMDSSTGRGQSLWHVMQLGKRLGLNLTTPRNTYEALTKIGEHLHGESKKAIDAQYWHGKAMEHAQTADSPDHRWVIHDFTKRHLPDEHVHGLARAMGVEPHDSLRATRHRIAAQIHKLSYEGTAPTRMEQKTPQDTPSQLPTRIK